VKRTEAWVVIKISHNNNLYQDDIAGTFFDLFLEGGNFYLLKCWLSLMIEKRERVILLWIN
jgi:hypothetical protein